MFGHIFRNFDCPFFLPILYKVFNSKQSDKLEPYISLNALPTELMGMDFVIVIVPFY